MQDPQDDTRGIVSPQRMFRHVQLERYPVPDALVGLVDWGWSVRWDLRMGFAHRQDVVAQPGVNLSVGVAPGAGTPVQPGPYPLRCTVTGVSTDVSTRVLTGTGWNMAAKTTTGGFGAWCDDVALLTDRVVPPGAVSEPHGLRVGVGEVAEAFTAGQRDRAAQLLFGFLVSDLERRPPQRVALSREVAAVASRAETDRSIRTVSQLAAPAGVTVRTLQRMFASCAGVSPTWVIRRFRLIEAAESVSGGQDVDWASVAAELGYADQAHLTRDFTSTIGIPPAAYARAQRSPDG